MIYSRQKGQWQNSEKMKCLLVPYFWLIRMLEPLPPLENDAFFQTWIVIKIRLLDLEDWTDRLFWNVGTELGSSWNMMAHCDAREGKWRGNWRMEWVASTLHTTSEHGVSSITTADAHNSAASSRLNWRPSRFKLTRTFRRKTKSGFCACAITFQTQSTTLPCVISQGSAGLKFMLHWSANSTETISAEQIFVFSWEWQQYFENHSSFP
jgi:hypothetical protein